jgi:hypothetical protein
MSDDLGLISLTFKAIGIFGFYCDVCPRGDPLQLSFPRAAIRELQCPETKRSFFRKKRTQGPCRSVCLIVWFFN